MDELSCAKCGERLPLVSSVEPVESRHPCPQCGSTSRSFKRAASVDMPFYSSVGVRQKRPGLNRPVREMESGTRIDKGGRPVRKVRIIDRERDRYVENVVDQRTGEVLADKDEKLSEHRSGPEKKEEKEGC